MNAKEQDNIKTRIQSLQVFVNMRYSSENGSKRSGLLFNGGPFLRLGLVVESHLGLHASVDGDR